MFKFRRFKHFNLIPIIFVTILLYKFIDNISVLSSVFAEFFSLLTYFIWGFAIAYLLNPLMMITERTFKTKRPMSILVTYFIFLSFISLFFILIIPGIIKSIGDLLNRLPAFVSVAERYINTDIVNNELFVKYGASTYISENLNDIVTRLKGLIEISFNVVITQLINFSSMLFNLFTGIVISVYLLTEKEAAINYIKKVLHIFLEKDDAKHIEATGSRVNLIFKQYVVGKSIDSLIIGILCFVGLQLLGVKYALIISLIIGVTNLIPYFGNTIGLIPTMMITIFSGPVSALKLLILVITLSLFDGWFLGPKIIGEKVGLSPIWIIVAITLGGGIYGMVGMFVAVPTVAVIKTTIESYVERKALEKALNNDKMASSN